MAEARSVGLPEKNLQRARQKAGPQECSPALALNWEREGAPQHEAQGLPGVTGYLGSFSKGTALALLLEGAQRVERPSGAEDENTGPDYLSRRDF